MCAGVIRVKVDEALPRHRCSMHLLPLSPEVGLGWCLISNSFLLQGFSDLTMTWRLEEDGCLEGESETQSNGSSGVLERPSG